MPEKRVAELSRGGPIGMVLEGFVTSRDAGGLERAAHHYFKEERITSSGGTEYFAASPRAVLTWLRSTAPRFDLELARQSAWAEYCASEPHRDKTRIDLIPGVLGAVCFWGGIFWHPFVWMVFAGMPFGFLLGEVLVGVLLRPKRAQLDGQLAVLRQHLEEKYHLPPGGVRFERPTLTRGRRTP
jgi:hypothetical protein